MAKLCIDLLHKNSSKNVLKENYYSNKFLGYLWLRSQKFLMELCHVYEKSHPQHGSQLFYLFEKAKNSCEEF